MTRTKMFRLTMLAMLLALLQLMLIGCDKTHSQTVTVNVTFSWTAPGDDGMIGQASAYDIRYARTSDSLTSFWSACKPVTGLPAPKVAGSPESVTKGLSLLTGVTYYSAIKTADETPNWSDISNIKSFIIPDTLKPNKVNDFNVTF